MAARKVIVRQETRGRATFATEVIKSPKGFHYFLFGTDRAEKAKVMTERQALKVLESWRADNITNSNRCSLEPTS
jgi:hypothetical protein